MTKSRCGWWLVATLIQGSGNGLADALSADAAHKISNPMQSELTAKQARHARKLFDFSTNVEHIGDINDHYRADLACSKQ